MLPLGLTAAEQRAFHRALRSHHQVKTTVQVMNLNRKRLADVSGRLVDGTVNVLDDAEVTRGCSLSLYDPKGHIALDSADPSDGAMFLNNAIRVVQSYTWPDLRGWVDVPVFDGPVTSVSRDADTLAVECQGWELRARKPVWEPKTFAVGYITDLIKSLMRMAGETRFDMPDLPYITTETLSLSRTSQPWKRARELAASVNRQLFYDGRGVLRLRRLPKHRAWTFTDGDDGMMTAPARISVDIADLANIVWVKGRRPKGANERVNDYAKLPGSNPLSPQGLGRNDRPQYLLQVVENDHMKTDRECHELAVDLVNEAALQAVTVELDSMPIPHIEPGDLAGVDARKAQQEFRLRRYTLPLAAGDSMAVGYTRELVKGRRAHNRPIQPMVIKDPPPKLQGWSGTDSGSSAQLLQGGTW